MEDVCDSCMSHLYTASVHYAYLRIEKSGDYDLIWDVTVILCTRKLNDQDFQFKKIQHIVENLQPTVQLSDCFYRKRLHNRNLIIFSPKLNYNYVAVFDKNSRKPTACCKFLLTHFWYKYEFQSCIGSDCL